jgi:cyclopropane-fatty-acyl-phospholipid synthase
MTVASIIEDLLGGNLAVRFEAYDGSVTGQLDASATIHIRTEDALNHILFGGVGEMGLARAYVSGEIEVEGDLLAVFSLGKNMPTINVRPRHLREIAKLLGTKARKLPPPPEEARRTARIHTLRRDKESVEHHYDVSNRFYEILLDQSMTYSCAMWESADFTLDQAQAAKHELVLRKLGLSTGDRLLEIGCGWGAHLIHAARHFGAHATGATISRAQAELGRKRIIDAGVADMVELREQDYREIADEPYDAISSIGMFEHVGVENTAELLDVCNRNLKPGGRILLHSITTREVSKRPIFRPDFIRAYIFPDGELLPAGDIVNQMQHHGFEVQHVESLRNHYAPTLKVWLGNLEANWDECVEEVGFTRARIWRLYLAGCAVNFDGGHLQVHQILATKDTDTGDNGFPTRPDWHAENLSRFGG